MDRRLTLLAVSLSCLLLPACDQNGTDGSSGTGSTVSSFEARDISEDVPQDDGDSLLVADLTDPDDTDSSVTYSSVPASGDLTAPVFFSRFSTSSSVSSVSSVASSNPGITLLSSSSSSSAISSSSASSAPASASSSSVSSAPQPVTGALSLGFEIKPAEAMPGDTIRYTLPLRNLSNAAVENITVQLDLPAGVTIKDHGGGTQTRRRIQWTLNRLEPTHMYTFRVEVQIDRNVGHGRVLSATASVSGGNLANPSSATAKTTVIRDLPATGIDLKAYLAAQSSAPPLTLPLAVAAGVSALGLVLGLWGGRRIS